MAGRYAAPMSFVGSANRIARWPQSVQDPVWKGLAWIGAVLTILMVWVLVFAWYLGAFMVAGPWLFVYRLFRHGQRWGSAPRTVVVQLTRGNEQD